MNRIDRVRHRLLHFVSQGARWVGQDDFPAWVEWADECERWLEFVQSAGQFDRFLPRLRDQKRRRDETLAEIGAAYFLERVAGVPISSWEPSGQGGTTGEFLVETGLSGEMFVEVKSPGWEAEIFKAEGKDSPRLHQPKYLDSEVRSGDPWSRIRETVAKAYLKMPPAMPTLLIICDDFMVPLRAAPDLTAEALYRKGVKGVTNLQEDGPFASGEYRQLGAVGTLNVDLFGVIKYSFSVFHNPNALPEARVPHEPFSAHPNYNSWPLPGIGV